MCSRYQVACYAYGGGVAAGARVEAAEPPVQTRIARPHHVSHFNQVVSRRSTLIAGAVFGFWVFFGLSQEILAWSRNLDKKA
jgi:hypothetical protein